tara:strand:- start:3708 stop:5576 length:1869 start_codon:yes stop_codon:yes gene_type:complete
MVYEDNANIWESGTNNNGIEVNNHFHISDTEERLIIQRGTGNIGIGTNNPTEKLEINGTTKSEDIILYSTLSFLNANVDLTTGSIFTNNTSGDKDLTISTKNVSTEYESTEYNNMGISIETNNGILKLAKNGKLGFGTSSPVEYIDFVLQYNSFLRINGLGHILMNNGNSPEKWTLATRDNGYFTIANDKTTTYGEIDNSNSKLTIKPNGNIGININEPTDKLHVNGTIKANNVKSSTIYSDTLTVGDINNDSEEGNIIFATRSDSTHNRLMRIGIDNELYFRIGDIGNFDGLTQWTSPVKIYYSAPNSSFIINEYGTCIFGNKILTSSNGIEFNDGSIMTSNNFSTGKWLQSTDSVNRFYFNTNGSTNIGNKITINQNSYVDITTNNGLSGSIANRPFWGSTIVNTSTTISTSDFNFPLSLKTNEAILTLTYFITNSDSRIKKDIQDLNDEECLNKLLALQPKKYKYIDTYARGDNYTYGFIAQEVENVIPESVKTTQQYPPNIYCNYNISNNDVILTDNLKYTPVLNHKLKINESNGNILYFDVVEIINDLNFKISNETNTILNGEYFIYGYLIYDFKSLSKDHFHAITVSSVQELHRKIEKQQQLINQLQEILSRNNIS